MADTTEAEELREQKQPHAKPNIAEIAALICADGPVQDGEAKSQRAAADNAKLYTRIEKDFHGNKDAVKAVRRLIKAGQAASDDFMRTFEPLADHFKLWPEGDLASEGSMRSGAAAQPGVGSDDDDDDDGDGDGDGTGDEGEEPAPQVAKPAAGPAPFASALDAARGHMTGRKKPDKGDGKALVH